MSTSRSVIAELLLDARCQVAESLIWHAKKQSLYWVDIPAKRLHCYTPSTQEHRLWRTPEMLGCIALQANGHFIAGGENTVFEIVMPLDHAHQPQFNHLATAVHSAQPMRFNDGRCDRQGRFMLGSMMCEQIVGAGNPNVYQYAPSSTDVSSLNPCLSLALLPQPFTTPNGMAFSPDGRKYYLSDSHASQQRVWVFDYDSDTGTAHNRREFIDMNLYPGRPDGAAIDTDGCYWVCATDAGMVHRFTPQGRLDYSLAVPVKKPTICTWGGLDLRTLYVGSIRPNPTTAQLTEQPLAGGIFAFEGLHAQGVA
jgi:sugar lactone lactonase YvrE